MSQQSSICLLAVYLLVSIVLPANALADVTVLGGDICQARNPATPNADGLRKVDGATRNISDELGATVVCPLFLGPSPNIDSGYVWAYAGKVTVLFYNSHKSEEQRFRCDLYIPEGHSAFPEDRITRKVDISPQSTGSLEFEPLQIFESGVGIPRPPSLTCKLQPQSEIQSIVIDLGVINDFI